MFTGNQLVYRFLIFIAIKGMLQLNNGETNFSVFQRFLKHIFRVIKNTTPMTIERQI